MKQFPVFLLLVGVSIGAFLLSSRNDEEPIATLTEPTKRHAAESSAPVAVRAEEGSASEISAGEPETTTSEFESFFGDQDAIEQSNKIIHEQLVATVGLSRADLLLALSKTKDWKQIKALINEHGDSDHELLMRYGLRTGEISSQELIDLWRSGAEFPPHAVMKIVGKMPIDDLLSLRNAGVPIDLTYRNPYSGKNALGQFIDEVTFSPSNYEPTQVATTIRKLIGAGVQFSPQDVEYAPLDFAIRNVTPENADQKLLMTELLLEFGAVPEQQHRELVNQMPTGALQDKFLAIL